MESSSMSGYAWKTLSKSANLSTLHSAAGEGISSLSSDSGEHPATKGPLVAL